MFIHHKYTFSNKKCVLIPIKFYARLITRNFEP